MKGLPVALKGSAPIVHSALGMPVAWLSKLVTQTSDKGASNGLVRGVAPAGIAPEKQSSNMAVKYTDAVFFIADLFAMGA